jgi:hypothetical protein
VPKRIVGSGYIVGVSYGPNAVLDIVAESFGAGHDTLNSLAGWYDELGNTKTFTGLKNVYMQSLNVINVGIAAPMGVATFAQEFGFAAIHGAQLQVRH